MTKILSARKPAVLGGLLFRRRVVPCRKKLYGITLNLGSDAVMRYNRITARRRDFCGLLSWTGTRIKSTYFAIGSGLAPTATSSRSAPSRRWPPFALGAIVVAVRQHHDRACADGKRKLCPYPSCYLAHPLELTSFVVDGKAVSNDRRGKAALRAERQPFQRHKAICLHDATNEVFGRFHLHPLGADQSEDHDLIIKTRHDGVVEFNSPAQPLIERPTLQFIKGPGFAATAARPTGTHAPARARENIEEFPPETEARHV
jgi:hypothetical protein